MASPTPNYDLILQGILRRARGMPDPLGWLHAQHGAALDKVMAEDEHVTNTSDEGGANAATREIPANTLLSLYEAAIQVLEAEDRAKSGRGNDPGNIRYADFSLHPSTLG